jgi:hypothetical protein
MKLNDDIEYPGLDYRSRKTVIMFWKKRRSPKPVLQYYEPVVPTKAIGIHFLSDHKTKKTCPYGGWYASKFGLPTIGFNIILSLQSDNSSLL